MWEEQKRTKLILKKWTQVHSKRTEGSIKKPKPKKREKAEDNPKGRGFKDLRKMFEEMGSTQAKESIGKEPEPSNEKEIKRSLKTPDR